VVSPHLRGDEVAVHREHERRRRAAAGQLGEHGARVAVRCATASELCRHQHGEQAVAPQQGDAVVDELARAVVLGGPLGECPGELASEAHPVLRR